MPIYTYRCESCGVQFERHQSFNEASLVWCPECNKKSLRKVYLPVGIVFKGSGFYATDHKSPSGQGRASTNKNDEAEKKGDSTPKQDVEKSSTNPKEKNTIE